MGRYLDLVRDLANTENSEVPARDTSDQGDRTRSSRGLSSLMSLLSRTDPLTNEGPKTEASTSFVSDLAPPHTEGEATAAAPSIHASALRSTAATKATELVQDAWCDVEEERAAVIEYDAGIPRAWAEGFARLDPNRPPGDVPARRWLRFVDDVGRFLDGDFAAIAAALGWGSFDLFGCDRDRPFARIDQAGLLWLLNGDRLIELTESTATIETTTGRRQTWRRKPAVDTWRALAWEFVR
jgi:hypothetical protein